MPDLAWFIRILDRLIEIEEGRELPDLEHLQDVVDLRNRLEMWEEERCPS